MAGTRERRVGRLRLRAADESQACRGVIILEDAFRTATLPCAEAGRLLVVRKLALGKFRAGQSPASVALLIERRVGELRTQAVHALDPRADSRPAVYFHDEAERYVLLASRLARGEDAAAWFWPAAVPGWERTLPRAESLRTLLGAAARSRAGAAAVAALLGELLARGGVESLLGSLGPADGVELLSACGWHAPTPANDEEAEARPAVPHDALLARWAGAWGQTDARTLWLSAMLLVSEKPARLLDPRLTSRAARLVERVTASAESRAHAEAESHRPAAPQRSAPQVERRRDAASATRDTQHVGRARDAQRSEPDVCEPERSAGDERGELRARPRDDAPRIEDTRTSRAADARVVELAHAGEFEQDARDDESVPHSLAPVARRGVEETAARNTSTASESRHAATGADELRESARDGDMRTTDGCAAEGSGVEGAVVYHVPARTCCAGLLFLVPVMSRLGVAAFLKASPRLIEMDFPRRLLGHVCERLRVPADDPVVRALGAEARLDTDDLHEFMTPASWRELYSPGPLRLKREAQTRARSLADGSGQLTLALWRGRAPSGVRELVAGRVLRRAGARGRLDGPTLLLEAWTRAMRRWCRRHARTGLSELVRREGRLLATATHLELFLDHGGTDLRVRSTGLDLDPGWVAWLGRVVQFHYNNWKHADGDF